ncbi:MAG: hypothetical protein HQ509_11930 [Candidatus Marinimicrobia bacterium]|nr:hypothetical protein [Candidatus Neomarinimicrobiota bacterium]
MDQTRIKEDLSIIKRIMEESRQNFYNYGINLVVWGGIVITELLLTYVNVAIHYFIPEYWYWLIGFSGGFLFEFIHGRKWCRDNHAIQQANRIGSTLWMSILLTIVLFGTVGVSSGVVNGEGASGFIAGLLAIGYLVTGELIKLPWVKRLGYGWWIGAIILFYTPGDKNLLLMALLMFLLQFIPGLILLVKGPKND